MATKTLKTLQQRRLAVQQLLSAFMGEQHRDSSESTKLCWRNTEHIIPIMKPGGDIILLVSCQLTQQCEADDALKRTAKAIKRLFKDNKVN